MGGSDGTSTTSNSYPPEITAAINNNVRAANNVASRPFTPYAQPFNGANYLAANADVRSNYDTYLRDFKPATVVNPDEVRSQALQDYRKQYGDGTARFVQGTGGEGGESGYWENQNAPELTSFIQDYVAKNGQKGPATPMTAEEYAKNHWLESGYLEGRAGGPEMRQRVADFTQDQQTGFGLARDVAGTGANFLERGFGHGVASEVAGYNVGQLKDTDLSPYMNPWTQNVIDTTLQDINRQNQIALNGVGSQAMTQGAYGGSRQGVAQAETNRAYADTAARADAGLRSQGFENAQQAALSDIGLGLQGQQLKLGAAQQMMNSANARNAALMNQQQFDTNRANILLGTGAQQQLNDQAKLDAQYEEFLRANNYPVDMIKVRQIPLSMNLPSTQTTNGPGQDNTGAYAGLAGAAMMAAATL